MAALSGAELIALTNKVAAAVLGKHPVDGFSPTQLMEPLSLILGCLAALPESEQRTSQYLKDAITTMRSAASTARTNNFKVVCIEQDN